jgi:hypothetical protein
MSTETYKGTGTGSGYPTNVKVAKETKMRGTGAATKGLLFNNDAMSEEPTTKRPSGPINTLGR